MSASDEDDPKPTSGPTTKAERLQVAGAVAPILRAARHRRVTLIGKDGAPIGVADAKDVALSLLARSKIELSVQDGERPPLAYCQACGRGIMVKVKGTVPRVCPPRTHLCAAGCGRFVTTEPGTCAAGKTCRSCRLVAENRASRMHTDEYMAKVISAARNYAEAAASLGMAIGPVHRHAKRLGVQPAGSYQQRSDEQIMAALANARTFREAAAALGLTPAAVQMRAKKLGLRPGGRKS